MESVQKRIFLSQSRFSLAKRLFHNLGQVENPLFSKRWLVVPPGWMRQWLLCTLAEGGCCMGVEVVSLEEFFPKGPGVMDLLSAIWETMPQEERSVEGAKALERAFRDYRLQKDFPNFWGSSVVQNLWQEAPFSLKGGDVHFFGFEHFAPLHWDWIGALPSCFLYLFSPSPLFLGDVFVAPQEEGAKRLSSLGRLGRETQLQVERFKFLSEEEYPKEEGDSHLAKMRFEMFSLDTVAQQEDDSVVEWEGGPLQIDAARLALRRILEAKVPFEEVSILVPCVDAWAPFLEMACLEAKVPYRVWGKKGEEKGIRSLEALVLGMEWGWTASSLSSFFSSAGVVEKMGWDSLDVEAVLGWIEEIGAYPTLFEGVAQKKACFWGGYGERGDLFSSVENMIRDLEEKRLALQEVSLVDAKEHLEFLLSSYIAWEEDSFWQKKLQALTSLRKVPFSLLSSWLREGPRDSLHANALHAVTIASLREGASIPRSRVVLVGFEEGEWPKKPKSSPFSLPSLWGREESIDRYSLLELLFSTKDGMEIVVREGQKASTLFSELRGKKKKKVPPYFPYTPPPSFSLCVPPLKILEKRVYISLHDLSSFARHPWRYFFSKTLLSKFPPREAPPFLALAKGVGKARRENNPLPPLPLPKGVLQEALLLLAEEKPKNAFPIYLLESQKEREGEFFPPLVLLGGNVILTGEIACAREEGALHFGDGKIPSLLREWPEILSTLVALQKREIFCPKTEKILSIEDPVLSLEKFVSYFLRMEGHLSPLMPLWAEALFSQKEGSLFQTGRFEDPLLSWMLERLDLSSWNMADWEWLEEVFCFADL